MMSEKRIYVGGQKEAIEFDEFGNLRINCDLDTYVRSLFNDAEQQAIQRKSNEIRAILKRATMNILIGDDEVSNDAMELIQFSHYGAKFEFWSMLHNSQTKSQRERKVYSLRSAMAALERAERIERHEG